MSVRRGYFEPYKVNRLNQLQWEARAAEVQVFLRIFSVCSLYYMFFVYPFYF